MEYDGHSAKLLKKTTEAYRLSAAERRRLYVVSKLVADQPLPRSSETDWSAALDQLNLDPGLFIGELYTMVGGGFVGPGYGTLPLEHSGPGLFNLVDYNLGRRKRNKAYWPEYLLALIDWGCGIVSCVDCESDQLTVVRFDPNTYLDARMTRRDWAGSFSLEAESFLDWWEAWLLGKDLWKDNRGFPMWDKYMKLLAEKNCRRRNRANPNQLSLDL